MKKRTVPINIDPDEFRRSGHKLIDQIADFIKGIEEMKVTKGEDPTSLLQTLVKRDLPENGTSTQEILDRSSKLLFEHSLLNGHPKFLGYITSSAAPIGALADLLATLVKQ